MINIGINGLGRIGKYVFLQLRAKSAGAKVKLDITCPDDEETKVEIEVNLEEIAVQHSVEHTQEIVLTEDIKLNLRYPRLKDLQGLNRNFGEFEQSMIMVYECIESVISGEEIINRIDITQDEITEFIDSFNTEYRFVSRSIIRLMLVSYHARVRHGYLWSLR